MEPLVILTIIGSVAYRLHEIKNIKELNQLHSQVDSLTNSLQNFEDISKNAERILEGYVSASNVGSNRGFILTSFAFLERNQNNFPETYQIAKELILDGVLITKSAPDRNLDEKWNEEKRMKDGAGTMKALLEGMIDK